MDLIGLGVSALPTGLFMPAGRVRRRSHGMQSSVDVAAALVAAPRIVVIRMELSVEWTHGTDLSPAAAWVIGMGAAVGVAVVVAIVAAIAMLRESTYGQWHEVEHAEPGAAADRGRMLFFGGSLSLGGPIR